MVQPPRPFPLPRRPWHKIPLQHYGPFHVPFRLTRRIHRTPVKAPSFSESFASALFLSLTDLSELPSRDLPNALRFQWVLVKDAFLSLSKIALYLKVRHILPWLITTVGVSLLIAIWLLALMYQ